MVKILFLKGTVVDTESAVASVDDCPHEFTAIH